MRKFVPLFAVTLLSGCGVVPPIIGLASYALDGISLAASGRTVTDHAISMAANQDCKLYRLGQDREVCTDWGTEPQVVIRETRSPDLPEDRTLLARVEPMRLPSDMADVAQALPGVATAEPVPVLQTALAPPPPKAGSSPRNMTALVPSAPERVAAPVAPAASPVARPAEIRVAARADDGPAPAPHESRYLMVIGSFKGPEMAGKLARLHAGSSARVMTAEVQGQTYYRVVVDPSRGAALVAKLAKTDDKPWILPAGQMQQVALATTLR
jgi:hypothetical protein